MQVYAPGFRNPYDLLIAQQAASMYTDRQRLQRGSGRRARSARARPATAPTRSTSRASPTPTACTSSPAGLLRRAPEPHPRQPGEHIQRRTRSRRSRPRTRSSATSRLRRQRRLDSRVAPTRARPTASPSTRRRTSAARCSGDLLLAAATTTTSYRIKLDATGTVRRRQRRAVLERRARTRSTSRPGRHRAVPGHDLGGRHRQPATSTCSSRTTSAAAAARRAPGAYSTTPRRGRRRLHATPTRSTTAPTRARPPTSPHDWDGDLVSDLQRPRRRQRRDAGHLRPVRDRRDERAGQVPARVVQLRRRTLRRASSTSGFTGLMTNGDR